VDVLETISNDFYGCSWSNVLIGTQGLDSRLGFRVRMQDWDSRSGYKCVTI